MIARSMSGFEDAAATAGVESRTVARFYRTRVTPSMNRFGPSS